MSTARLRVLILPLIVLFSLFASARVASAQCAGNKTGRYKVKIDSVPAGAQIYIESKNCPTLGTTPWSGKLPNGSFTVILEAPGYEPTQKQFNVGRLSRVQTLSVTLNKRPTLEIRADADRNLIGASVSLDGVPQGVIQGPLTIQTTAARHQVEIKKEGFETLTQWVDLSSTPQLVLTPTLKEVPKPKYGTIVIEADVQDAEVYIDGNKHPDNTPSVINNVIEGVHVIEVKKAPGPPWRQTVQVTANQQTKVRAELAPLLNGGVGVIRVLSDTPGARAFLDGTDMGPVPVDIKDVKAGEHIVQVKAEGFQTGEKTVTVAAGGSQIVKFDLNAAGPGDQGIIKVNATVPDAEVFIDGAAVGKAPIEKKLSKGEHNVLIRLAGYKEIKQNVSIEAGQTFTLQADLKAVGRIRVLSTPSGATVLVNGVAVGTTPFDQEVEVGETLVQLDSPGRIPWKQTINVEGGKTQTLAPELAIQGKSEMEIADEQKGLSSWGARTLPRGRSTVDFEAGYPYFLGAKITVGAGRLKQHFGFDASVGVRTFLSRTELGFGARLMLANQDPFSAAVFSDLWFGSRLLDNSMRSGVTWNAGAAASLTALSNVTITGRAYFQFWSDRHCPALQDGSTEFEEEDAEPTQTCKDYLETQVKMTADYMPGEDFSARSLERLVGMEDTDSKRDFFGRDNGARFLLSIAAEIATQQRWNIYGVLEGAPFQDERALFTNAFSGAMPETDFILYARFGATYKF